MFSFRSNDYVPLLDESRLGHSGKSSEDSFDSSTPYLDKEKPKTRRIPWTLVVVVACTVLNVVLSIFPTILANRREEFFITRQNIHLLRRPNQYIGFDEIPRPSPPISRQLNTYPTLISLVDAESPETVFDDGSASQMVHIGTITPDDRRVRITPTISTIVQFRAIDWGMEICELHIDLPESYGQEGHSGSLAVYRINATTPLDGASLSYNTRPQRIAKLGNILLGAGSVAWHRKFSCATDDVLSFELGCLPREESAGDANCLVDWVQIKDALPAIHMVQYPTA